MTLERKGEKNQKIKTTTNFNKKSLSKMFDFGKQMRRFDTWEYFLNQMFRIKREEIKCLTLKKIFKYNSITVYNSFWSLFIEWLG